MTFKVTRLGYPLIRQDTIRVGDTVFTEADLLGSALDYAETGDIEPVGTVADGGTSDEVARGDHVHTLDPEAVEAAGRWEVLMDPTATFPPDPIQTVDGTDWVYGWVT